MQVPAYQSCTSLVKFIPESFILLDATVNKIIYLNLFSDGLFANLHVDLAEPVC